MDAAARIARARMAAKKARRDRRRVSRKARGQALVKTTVVKNLGKIQDDLESNLPPLRYLPEVDLRKYAVTNPFDWRPVTRLRRYKHPKKYPIPVLDRLVQRHYKATRETQLGIDGEYKALMYMLIATLISPPYNKAVMIIDLAHEFDASEVLKHAPYTWRKIPMPQRPVPIRSKIHPRPRSNKRKAARQLQRPGSGKKSKGIPPNQQFTTKPMAEQVAPTSTIGPDATEPSAGTVATDRAKEVAEETSAGQDDEEVVKFKWVRPKSQQGLWGFLPAEKARLQKRSKSRGKGVGRQPLGAQHNRSPVLAPSRLVRHASIRQEEGAAKQAGSNSVPGRKQADMAGPHQHVSGEARILAQALSREPVPVRKPLTQLQALRSVPRPQPRHLRAGAGKQQQTQCATEPSAKAQADIDVKSVKQPKGTAATKTRSSKVPPGIQNGMFGPKMQRPLVKEPEPPAWNHGYYLQTPRQRIQRRTAAKAGAKRKRSATSTTDINVVPLAKRPALPKRLAELKRYRQPRIPVQPSQPSPPPRSRAQLKAERKAATLLERRAAVYAAQVKWAEEHEAELGEKKYPRWMPSASRLRGRDDIFDHKYPENIDKRWMRLAEGRFKIIRDTAAVPKHPPYHHPWMARPETAGFWPAAKPRPKGDTPKVDVGSTSTASAKPTSQSSGKPPLAPEVQAKIDASRRAAEARWAANPNKDRFAAELRTASRASATQPRNAAAGDTPQGRSAITQDHPAAEQSMTATQQPPQRDTNMSRGSPAGQRAVKPQYSPNTKARIEANRRAAEERYYASGKNLTTSSKASDDQVKSSPQQTSGPDSSGKSTPRIQYSPETQAKIAAKRLAAEQRYIASGNHVIAHFKPSNAQDGSAPERPSSSVKTQPSAEVLAMIEAKKLAARQKFEAKGKYMVAQAQAEMAKERLAPPSAPVTVEQPAPYVPSQQDTHGDDGDEEVYAEFEDSGEHDFDFDTMDGVVLGSQDDVDCSQTDNLDKVEDAYDDEAQLITGSQARLAIERRLAARREPEQSEPEADQPYDNDEEGEVLTGTQARLATERRISAARAQEDIQAVTRANSPLDDGLRQSPATEPELAAAVSAAERGRAALDTRAMPPPPPPRLELKSTTQPASHAHSTVMPQQSITPFKQDTRLQSRDGGSLSSHTQDSRISSRTSAKRKRADTQSLPRGGGGAELVIRHQGSEDMRLSFSAGQVFEEQVAPLKVKPAVARKAPQPKQAVRPTPRFLGSEDVPVDHLGMIIAQDPATTEATGPAAGPASLPKQAVRGPIRHQGSEDMEVDITGMPIDQTASTQEKVREISRVAQPRRAVRPMLQSYGSEDMQVDTTGQMIEQETALAATSQSTPRRAVKQVRFAESDDIHVFDTEADVAQPRHSGAYLASQPHQAPLPTPSRRGSERVQLDIRDLLARRSAVSATSTRQSTSQQPNARQMSGEQGGSHKGKVEQVTPAKSRSKSKSATSPQQPTDVESRIRRSRLAAQPRRVKKLAVRSLETGKDHARTIASRSGQQRSAAEQARIANHLLVAKARLAKAKQMDHRATDTTPDVESRLPADVQERIITYRVAAQRRLAVNMGMEDPSVLSRNATRLRPPHQRLPDDQARLATAREKFAAIRKREGKKAAREKHEFPEVEKKIRALRLAARKKAMTARKNQRLQTINRRTAVERKRRAFRQRCARKKLAEAKLVLSPDAQAKLVAQMRAAQRKMLARRKVMARIIAAEKHIARLPHNVRLKLVARLESLRQKLKAKREMTSRILSAQESSTLSSHDNRREPQQQYMTCGSEDIDCVDRATAVMQGQRDMPISLAADPPGSRKKVALSRETAHDQSGKDVQSVAVDTKTASFLRTCRDLGIHANLAIAEEALAQAPGGDPNEAMNWLLDKQTRGELPSKPEQDEPESGPSIRQSSAEGQPGHKIQALVAAARRRRAKRLAVRARRTRRSLALPYVQSRLKAIQSKAAASAQDKATARDRYEESVRVHQTPELVEEPGRVFHTMFGSEDFDCVLGGSSLEAGPALEGGQAYPLELQRKIDAVKRATFERLVARLAREPHARLVQARRQLRQVIAQANMPATKQHGTEQKRSFQHQAVIARLARVTTQSEEIRPTRYGREPVPREKSKLSDVWTHEYEPAKMEVAVSKQPENSREERHARKQKEILYLRYKLQKGLFRQDQQPGEEEMKKMSDYISMLEHLPDLETSIVRDTKLSKLLKAILKLDNIAQEEKFHFKSRSQALLDQWNKNLEAADPHNDANDTNSNAAAVVADGKEMIINSGVTAEGKDSTKDANLLPARDAVQTEPPRTRPTRHGRVPIRQERSKLAVEWKAAVEPRPAPLEAASSVRQAELVHTGRPGAQSKPDAQDDEEAQPRGRVAEERVLSNPNGPKQDQAKEREGRTADVNMLDAEPQPKIDKKKNKKDRKTKDKAPADKEAVDHNKESKESQEDASKARAASAPSVTHLVAPNRPGPTATSRHEQPVFAEVKPSDPSNDDIRVSISTATGGSANKSKSCIKKVVRKPRDDQIQAQGTPEPIATTRDAPNSPAPTLVTKPPKPKTKAQRLREISKAGSRGLSLAGLLVDPEEESIPTEEIPSKPSIPTPSKGASIQSPTTKRGDKPSPKASEVPPPSRAVPESPVSSIATLSKAAAGIPRAHKPEPKPKPSKPKTPAQRLREMRQPGSRGLPLPHLAVAVEESLAAHATPSSTKTTAVSEPEHGSALGPMAQPGRDQKLERTVQHLVTDDHPAPALPSASQSTTGKASTKSSNEAASVRPGQTPAKPGRQATSTSEHAGTPKSKAGDQLKTTGTTNSADQSGPGVQPILADSSKPAVEAGVSKSTKAASKSKTTADGRTTAQSRRKAKPISTCEQPRPDPREGNAVRVSGDHTLKPTVQASNKTTARRPIAHPRRKKTRTQEPASRPKTATAQAASSSRSAPARPAKPFSEARKKVKPKSPSRPAPIPAQPRPPGAAPYPAQYRPPLQPFQPKQVDRADLQHVYVCRPRFHPKNSYFWEAEGYQQTKHVVDTARTFIRAGKHLQNSADREMWGTIILGHKRSLADEGDFEADVICGTVKGWLTVKPEIVRPFQPGRSVREYLAAREMRNRDKEAAGNLYATSPWAQMVFNRRGMAELNWDRAWQGKRWRRAVAGRGGAEGKGSAKTK